MALEHPKRAEDLIHHLGWVDIHQTNFLRTEVGFDRLEKILKHGLIPSGKADELNARVGKIIFDLPLGSYDAVHSMRYDQQNKDLFSGPKLGRRWKTMRHPTIIFHKPDNERQRNSPVPGWVHYSRIQPRFIVGVVLPNLPSEVLPKWIEKLARFKKAIYGHNGDLLWSPVSEGK